MKQHEIDALIDEHDMGAWRTLMHRYTHALLSKAIPEGYAVVPKEPTEEMRAIGYESYRSTLNNPKWVEFMFKAMIAAAPSVKGEVA